MGEDIDGRADQYSLAATAYHLLTGSHLFPHSNTAVVISRHLNSPPPALADTRPELAALDPVLAAALAKDPGDRFPRCADLAHALAEQAALVPPPVRHLPRPLRQAAKQPLPRHNPQKRSSAVGGSLKRWLTVAILAVNCLGARGRAGVAALAARAVSKHADVKLAASGCYGTDDPADGRCRSASAASGQHEQR